MEMPKECPHGNDKPKQVNEKKCYKKEREREREREREIVRLLKVSEQSTQTKVGCNIN